jgi:hypothetical protein
MRIKHQRVDFPSDRESRERSFPTEVNEKFHGGRRYSSSHRHLVTWDALGCRYNK